MQLPDVGVGVVYDSVLRPLAAASSSLIDVLEIEPQTRWRPLCGNRIDTADGTLVEELRDLPQAHLVHSVGAPVGGSHFAEIRQMELLAQTVSVLESPWASEHLAFDRVGGDRPFHAGFFLPPCQNLAGVRVAVRNIQELRKRLSVPLAVETGVNYLRPRPDEIADGDFVAMIAEEADCGLLLDLHNVWTNARNGRQPVDEFLAAIPRERVWEVHLAGGRELDGYWLDAHSDVVPTELMSIARAVVPALPELHAIVFEILPQYVIGVTLNRIERQLAAMHELWELRRPTVSVVPVRPTAPLTLNSVTPELWELTLASLVIGDTCEGALASGFGCDPGSALLRTLAAEARASAIVSTLPFTLRMLMMSVGPSVTRDLIGAFRATHTPELFAANEALAFIDFLRCRALDAEHLDAVVAFEAAVIRATIDRRRTTVHFSCNPEALFAALAAREALPPAVPGQAFVVHVGIESVPST